MTTSYDIPSAEITCTLDFYGLYAYHTSTLNVTMT